MHGSLRQNNKPIWIDRCRGWRVLLRQAGRTIEVANLAENDREDLLQDLSSIVYSMCARLYGQRRAKRKQALIGKILAKSEGEPEGAS